MEFDFEIMRSKNNKFELDASDFKKKENQFASEMHKLELLLNKCKEENRTLQIEYDIKTTALNRGAKASYIYEIVHKCETVGSVQI
jgi:hypothetical protein